MTRAVRQVAVVGLGWVALNRHIPQILRRPDLRLCGVVDRRAGRAAEVGARLAVRWAETDRLQDVKWLECVDIVIVAAAPDAHRDLVVSALELGKHVLVEKPFAMTPEEGRQMAAAAGDRVLAVVHNFQFSRATRSLAGDIRAGTIGEIRSIAGVQFGNPKRRLPRWFDELPLGLFYDESPHLLYLLCMLAATPLRVRRVEAIRSTTRLATPAQVNVTLFEEGGVRPFAVRCNFEAPISEWYLTVCGEQALGIVDVFRDIYIRLPNDGSHAAWPVLRTSLTATWSHWRQVCSQGLRHATKRLYYGNDEVYARFIAAIGGDREKLRPIDAAAAQRILELQHDVIRHARAQG